MPRTRPVMLVILDGWGWRLDADDNAVLHARTPVYDELLASCPYALLEASGSDVGLPSGQMGNSEVGHLNIGAGRVVMQDLPRISQSIESGEIARNAALLGLIATLKASKGTCHLMGLVSPGGVHSHQDHILGLARVITAAGVPVLLHAFTDGRDTPPKSAREYLAQLEADLPEGAAIATLCGRYFVMDRDKRWERVTRAYDLLVDGKGTAVENAAAAIEASYAAGVSDEFLEPAVISGYAGMRDGDGLLCANFRADRVREILAALVDPAFDGFARTHRVQFASAVGLTSYSDDLAPLMHTMFEPQSMSNVLGEVVSNAGLAQLRAAETEKYAHVTYFLNGGNEVAYPGEDRLLVPSPKVATYDLQPEMSAPELTEKAVAAINSAKYDLIVLNYANPDMVGHTGSLPAAIKAVEAVDTGLGQLVNAVRSQGGAMLVIADHGNCEVMRDPETGNPHTSHTTNPVPVLLVGGKESAGLVNGRLADVAPTLLALMGLPQPVEMTGKPLLR